MSVAYVIVTVLAAAANLFAAGLDFVRHPMIVSNLAKTGLSERWVIPAGVLKGAGGLGLLLGFAVPAIGTAAAIGLVLFFVTAFAFHLWARFYALANWSVFFALSVAALAVDIAYRGAWA
ncbi:DoxX family protein [Actinomadura fulvescens]|uniref:DoxX family protein n=1 Tax=Actinomadura fulvescens TaxID=46160 RepID=A0ABP6C791_9ACTN